MKINLNLSGSKNNRRKGGAILSRGARRDSLHTGQEMGSRRKNLDDSYSIAAVESL